LVLVVVDCFLVVVGTFGLLLALSTSFFLSSSEVAIVLHCPIAFGQFAITFLISLAEVCLGVKGQYC
jgi:hypothetical protein